jgi:hypothetical protein
MSPRTGSVLVDIVVVCVWDVFDVGSIVTTARVSAGSDCDVTDGLITIQN